MSDGTPKIATLVVDLEARGMAQEAKSAGLLSQQAISDHMRTCERDKKLTTDALRDLAQGIKDVDAAGRERAVRQHERMDAQGAVLSEIKTELAAMPKQIADAVAASQNTEKRSFDPVGMFSQFKVWVLGGLLFGATGFIAYLLFYPNPFVKSLH